MEVYDDRPVSVYDNLSMPATVNTNTAKLKPQIIPTTSSTSASSTAATAALNGTDPHSPLYTEISFKFSDNNKQHQQQQKQPIIPNGNRSSNHSQQQQITSQLNSPCYATPHKLPPNNTTAQALPVANTIAANVSPVQRPLSQHSQSELNEASHSIAAVKAALNDAKSKFFGLNGYAPDTTDLNNESQLHKLLPNVNESYQPKVQIITPSPPPKPQPKYQNIPENSAIFRNQPPELPPKPSEWQTNKSNTSNSPVFRATTPSPAASSSNSSPGSQMAPHKSSALAASTPLPTPAPIQQPSKGNIPHSAAYKQVPLSDIDNSQPSQVRFQFKSSCTSHKKHIALTD
ncbi:flocculation protein FLO11-like [Teleopsis dalmanni]|uniref:flocculation protein FLO11-like n=1 Tax=Teleopsis dalmanni TaxID=139649 RepID=UPI0018CE4EF4|nr:flocculation protein FLO11-like [Teleopsis dalmanni]